MRLIDGDSLQQEFEDLAAIQWNKDTCTTCARVFKESAERVEDAKTVDAVPVVRCEDCKYIRKSYIKGVYECGRMQVATGLNEFCSRGERNENNREKDTAELLQSGRTKCEIV